MTVKELVKVLDIGTCCICEDLQGNLYYNISSVMDFKVISIYVKKYDLFNPLEGKSEEVTGLWIKILKSGGTE